MHLKRYRSATVREALAQARAELGPDALVLSTRLVNVRGVRGWFGSREVELTAAHDSVMSESRPSARSADISDEIARTLGGVETFGGRETFGGIEKTASFSRLGGTQGGSFGGGLTSYANGPARGGRTQDQIASDRFAERMERMDDDGDDAVSAGPVKKDGTIEALIARLCATGLHRDFAERIAQGVPRLQRRNGSLAALEKSVATELADFAAGDEAYAAVELFVGPPGAGKTTTIAKIAAQERARRGHKLNLLAADGFRVGAVEQLRIYADIIGSSFAVARTPAEIERSILTTRGTVLVDTAGRSVRDPRAQEVVAMLSGLPGVRTHLVMPAAASVRDLRNVLEAYGDKGPNRVVLTRIDEADSVSPLMHVLRERGLKVSYLGTGQRVPEDLERATPARLAAHVLGHGVLQGAPQGIPA
jgi:flagellar biosynthesis protein FlhF